MLKALVAATACFLAGIFGCAKSGTPPSYSAGSEHSEHAVMAKVAYLGVLQLTNRYETCVALGNGTSCRIVPEMLDSRKIQITLTLETKSADGKTSGLNVVQLMGEVEKPCQVPLGNEKLAFTPRIVAEVEE